MKLNYDYTKLYLGDIVNGNRFKVPQFQRNVVWNKKKRTEFVKNIREGNPFGSILVYKDENNDYSLIDGLQRISTIKDFYKDPFKYIDYEDINTEYIENIIKRDYELKNNIVFDSNREQNKIKEIKKEIFKHIQNGLDATSIKYKIVPKYGFLNDETIERNIINAVEDLKKNINIDGIIIPTIEYIGPKEKLPDIFYNLNTGGVNLSKYETFSSLWNPQKYIIDDEDIIDKIYEKYENLREKSDLDVDVTMDDIKEQGINLFEYCYSISEILRDPNKEYIKIIGENKKSTDPIGFELLTIIAGLPVNKAENLDEYFKGCNSDFLIKLKKYIIETFDVMVNSLKNWIVGLNGSLNSSDSTYMIYHMFMSYFKNNYDVNFDKFVINRVDNKDWITSYKKYLHLHYFYDYLSDYWKINRQVADLTRELNSPEKLDKYTKNIPQTAWNDLLDDYFRNDQLKNSTSTISNKSKLFIDYLCKFKIDKDRNLTKYFNKNLWSGENVCIDYEHIVPQKVLLDHYGKTRFKVSPISCVGNLCYLASKDNRSKHNKTIYEYSDDRPSFILNKEYLDLIDYPHDEELKFINYPDEAFEREYLSFIESRLDSMIKEFKQYL